MIRNILIIISCFTLGSVCNKKQSPHISSVSECIEADSLRIGNIYLPRSKKDSVHILVQERNPDSFEKQYLALIYKNGTCELLINSKMEKLELIKNEKYLKLYKNSTYILEMRFSKNELLPKFRNIENYKTSISLLNIKSKLTTLNNKLYAEVRLQ